MVGAGGRGRELEEGEQRKNSDSKKKKSDNCLQTTIHRAEGSLSSVIRVQRFIFILLNSD
jgi:hypothetical protein